jgi:hypothetical protein
MQDVLLSITWEQTFSATYIASAHNVWPFHNFTGACIGLNTPTARISKKKSSKVIELFQSLNECIHIHTHAHLTGMRLFFLREDNEVNTCFYSVKLQTFFWGDLRRRERIISPTTAPYLQTVCTVEQTNLCVCSIGTFKLLTVGVLLLEDCNKNFSSKRRIRKRPPGLTVLALRSTLFLAFARVCNAAWKQSLLFPFVA